jgi:hypothetical protein
MVTFQKSELLSNNRWILWLFMKYFNQLLTIITKSYFYFCFKQAGLFIKSRLKTLLKHASETLI